MVNLTQALAEEWEPLGIRVNCINPERTSTPMRTSAFGVEPPETLLSARTVALSAIDALVSEESGQVMDVRIALDETGLDLDSDDTIGEALEERETFAARRAVAPVPEQDGR